MTVPVAASPASPGPAPALPARPACRYLQWTGLADISSSVELRTGTFDGNDYLIVPVIAMLGNSVVRPLNSRGPEFIPASVIAAAPVSWNGRPVVMDHPNNGRTSANDPATLERYAFGHVFNTRFEDNKLKLDAWLSRSKAEKVGTDALDVITRCQNREPVEVSVGAYVGVAEVNGISPTGEPYEWMWTDIAASDHLAMLPEGATGACSVDMGCGAPRVNRAQQSNGVNDNDSEVKPMAASDTTVNVDVGVHMPKFMRRLLTAIGISSHQEDEGVSDVDLRTALSTALRAVEPMFEWIQEVFPDSSTVIYTSAPENELIWWRRTFVVGEDGKVALNDDRERVEPVTRYEPVAAEAVSDKPACSCRKNEAASEVDAETSPHNPEVTMADSKKQEIISRIVANKAMPFNDPKMLEALTEKQLADVESKYAGGAGGAAGEKKDETPPSAPVQASTAPAADAPETVSLSRDDYEAMRAAASAHRAAEARRKDALVTALKGAQRVYDEAKLRAMSIEQLEDTAKLLEVNTKDYSGRALSIPAGKDQSIYLNPPDPWKLKANKRGGNDSTASDSN